MNYKLKFAIIKSSKNQIRIAKETEIPESRLSKIVNGYIDATDVEMYQIAKALGMAKEKLFDRYRVFEWKFNILNWIRLIH